MQKTLAPHKSKSARQTTFPLFVTVCQRFEQIVVIDVRTELDFDHGHIPGALNLQFSCHESEDCTCNISGMKLVIDSAIKRSSFELSCRHMASKQNLHNVHFDSQQPRPKQDPECVVIIVYDFDGDGRSTHVANFMSPNLRSGEVSRLIPSC